MMHGVATHKKTYKNIHRKTCKNISCCSTVLGRALYQHFTNFFYQKYWNIKDIPI